ncbi:hypothetical protein IMZ48_38360 [Candidatus Bathyarchaeota archaeon]|nr:hypothetical protein [Candidatus Bathyarchaeota archaeon]
MPNNTTNNASAQPAAAAQPQCRCSSCRKTKAVVEFTRSSKENGPLEADFKSCNRCRHRCMNRAKSAARPTWEQFEELYVRRDQPDKEEVDEGDEEYVLGDPSVPAWLSKKPY